jgi:archaellum component FlaC
MYSALLIFCLIYIVILNYRNGDLNEQIEDLDERLTKLEKDAVKITFQSKPNPKQFDGVKSEEPFLKTRTKRKPKTTKDWEDEFDLGGHE